MSLLCTLKENKIPRHREPIDFMPFSKKPERPSKTPAQAELIFRQLVAQHNGNVQKAV